MKIKKMSIEKNKDESQEKNMIKIIKGSLLAIVITIVALLIFSVILTYTNVKESTTVPVIFAVMVISIIIGSFISVRKVKKKGLINGAIVGLIYIITIYILSSIFATTFALNMYSFLMIIFAVLAGILGGIMGVNM